MTQDDITRFVVGRLDGATAYVASAANGAPEMAWGDTFFLYDPDGDPANLRFPFATMVTKDYEGFDTVSDLDRPGVFRVNIWVSRETFDALVGGGDGPWEFTSLDTVMPHPIYGAQSWLSILNPGAVTSELTRTLLTEAHQRAKVRHAARRGTPGGGVSSTLGMISGCRTEGVGKGNPSCARLLAHGEMSSSTTA